MEGEMTAMWQITSKRGEDMGAHEGATADEAVEAMHRDAGYESSAAAAEALGRTVEELRSELTVEPVEG